MARYIDADLLTDKLEELQFNAPVMTPVMKIYNVIELVEDQPTADVAEVKHGEWIYNVKYYSCSICAGKRFNLLLGTDAEFCPYCGAKMDGERRDT